ncbi:hypothetical protein L218DRAFT_1080990 [Marasmius fiardii PR-910]|nr:hypothetical protein L218DRAFT_1080990 [Marasmius fiardii PR-910]
MTLPRMTTSILLSSLPSQESHSSHVGMTAAAPVSDLEPPPLKRRECIPLPSQCDSTMAVVIHPLLSCAKRAGIERDLTELYEGIEKVVEDRWHPLEELASYPALPSMTVMHRWLPRPITIHASGMDSRGVTVADVLITISKEVVIGISYLQGKRNFIGLQSSEIGGDVWELIIK